MYLWRNWIACVIRTSIQCVLICTAIPDYDSERSNKRIVKYYHLIKMKTKLDRDMKGDSQNLPLNVIADFPGKVKHPSHSSVHRMNTKAKFIYAFNDIFRGMQVHLYSNGVGCAMLANSDHIQMIIPIQFNILVCKLRPFMQRKWVRPCVAAVQHLPLNCTNISV